MGNSYFKFKSKTDLRDSNETTKLDESDFSLVTSDDSFIQFEYVEGDEDTSVKKYAVKSGLYTITVQNQQMVLKDAVFSEDRLLNEYVVTKDITDKINTFFDKVSVYKQYGIFPKRGILLYGSPGAGKSVAISKICNEYAKQEDTIVVIWPSDKLEAKHVKDFLKSFDYDTHKVKKIILVIEDLGGVEQSGNVRASESSLLSLLDNVDGTFSIPTMIVATTNFPESFLENLTDRPQRFDDVMEVKRPSAAFRSKFLEFFSQGAASESALALIQEKKYDVFSVAHIKEIVIRSAIYNIDLSQAIEQVLAQSSKSKKGFSNQKTMGFNNE
jgi:ATP-dependent 26S proteasome regulatory subunit